jgi:2-oxoglutarate dehydrogenase E2 component (dihydrolipoamide succinyltransferase)
MAIDIKVPSLGESVTEATVGKWFKKVGDTIKIDEPLCELETDKVTVEVPSPSAGTLVEIKVAEGETVAAGGVLGAIREGAAGAATVAAPQAQAQTQAVSPKANAPAVAVASNASPMPPAPSARRMMEEIGLTTADVAGSGRRGQVLKEDVMAASSRPAPVTAASAAPQSPPQARSMTPASYAPPPMPTAAPSAPRMPSVGEDGSREERVKMTRLRLTIARRLKDAQNTAAMLTTFNDVDMSNVMKLRTDYKELFEKRHGTKLGFMGFFVKACIQALREIPAVNAEIDGQDIVFKNYYHIGVAVGTEKGLVVPVVREADHLNLAEIEKTIAAFGKKARDGKLGIEDMQGGTFTISNGGTYGSMMSTPILNAPQSGILGMHRIEERPVARNGQVVIRPMMYLALSYDHRIVDGKDAVTFLVRVKECLEDPQRFVLEL